MNRKVICILCGKVEEATGYNQKYCRDCRKENRKDRQREYMRRKRNESSN